MSHAHAPLAPSDLPAHPLAHLPFEPVVERLTAKWPQHRAALLSASPGFALIASVDGNWLLAPCGPDADPAVIEGRIERYMINRFILITGAPTLTIAQAAAARRIAHQTLSGPAAMPILGPCPAGAAVGPSDYAALRIMVGMALHRLHDEGVLPAQAAPRQLETGVVTAADAAAAAALAAFNPIAASPLRLEGDLHVRVVEVVGGYVLLPGSCIDLAASGGAERISRLLEDSHAGLLLAQQGGIYWLQQPIGFATLEAIAIYCLGDRAASEARWHWMTEVP
ncbi:hypothetical protein [Devosia ginsengisoli]|uniref:Uncharacterized protein n=1 Tax=Devosia ginsengisoli TaxID=400770 RepID=A0A5B8LTR1_9HYPH|nr:hypothetical protein [Devosia ginsengisoli]QDZ11603.1 hypothetical protein FPZ08_13050 [Devosia ginsengisoli]